MVTCTFEIPPSFIIEVKLIVFFFSLLFCLMSNDKVYISLVNHIEEKIGPLVNVLVINLESNLTSDAGA